MRLNTKLNAIGPRGPDRAVVLTQRTAPQPPLAADLASLRPLRLDAVADRPGSDQALKPLGPYRF